MILTKVQSLIILGAALFTGVFIHAQSINPQSLNSSGTKMIQSNGSISFTLGELVVLKLTDINGNILGNGFVNGSILTTVNLQETDTSILNLKVFPNPTNELVNIQINHSTIDQISVSITDLQGKEIYNGNYAAVSNVIGINTSTYTTGTYFLSIKNTTGRTIGNYKIIKH